MSTRCMIHFGQSGRVQARIFRHMDGYPSAVLPDLERFFGDSKQQTPDTRFEDPTMLAARYVVWQANENRRGHVCLEGGGILDFLSLRVMLEDSGDVEHIYFVDSGMRDAKGFPPVTHRAASNE